MSEGTGGSHNSPGDLEWPGVPLGFGSADEHWLHFSQNLMLYFSGGLGPSVSPSAPRGEQEALCETGWTCGDGVSEMALGPGGIYGGRSDPLALGLP